MLIKEVMNEVVAIDKDISIKEAAKIMSDKDIGSLVAVKGEEIMGIVTEKDITKNVSNNNKKISSVMNKQVYTIEEDDDLDDAAEIMKKNKVKHLPVIDSETGKLVGIISATEIINNSDELEEDFFFK